jgi:hypothetical protein
MQYKKTNKSVLVGKKKYQYGISFIVNYLFFENKK